MISRDVTRKLTLGGLKPEPMASAGARAYNGGLGAELPAGSRGQPLVRGVRKLIAFSWIYAHRTRQISPLFRV